MIAAAHLTRFVLPAVAAGLCGVGVTQVSAPTGGMTSAGLPATQATSPETAARANSSATGSGRRSEVHYSDGLLTVTARDASLNAILREVSQQTGMTITGGVRDDRVFGTYGPDQPSTVLSTLLDGSGSNILLVNNTAGKPAQLILSPRTGGPTPPSQIAAERQQEDRDSDESAPPPARFGPQSPPAGIRVGEQRGYPSNSQSGLQPGTNLNPPITSPTTNNSDSQAVVFPPVNATTTPATATTSSDVTQDAPGGIKTPQQIFEQLQRLRQQQEQTQPQAQDSTQQQQ